MPASAERDAASASSIERVVFFSDAVFAISITLLALDLRIPETLAVAGDRGLVDALLDLAPALAAFVLSFTVIAAFWIGHFRTFRVIVRIDTRLLVVNLTFLAAVALIPFPTSVVAQHGELASAAIFYAVFQIVASLLSTLTWVYPAQIGHLVSDTVTPRLARAITERALVVPLIFAVSIPVVFVSPIAAELLWFTAFPAQALIARRLGIQGLLAMPTAVPPTAPE